MNDAILAVRCHRFGPPLEVVQVDRLPLGDPGPGQVRVRMLAAPVNPADINVIEGRYGKPAALPASLGNEGAGRVEALGPGVAGLREGQLVRPVPGVGSWQEALITTPDRLMTLPAGLTDEQAAMFCINPPTAWRMLHDFVALRPGEWVAQNAATSAVGRFVIQLCRHLGLRSLSVVRRQEACAELEAEGGDVVVTEEVDLRRELGRLRGGERPRLALNAVGGPSALGLARILARGGTLVTYGAMGKQPLTIPNALLIFSDIRFVGYWMTAWYEAAAPAAIEAMFDELGPLFARGVLRHKVARSYPLSGARDAVAHAMKSGRDGKIVLRAVPA